jgi:hypothetical protein
MKIQFITAVLAMFIWFGESNAQTVIKDKDYVSGTWKKSGSPYIIEGEAIVEYGMTLTIKPGVVVLFMTGENRDYTESSFDAGFLRVNGTLIAKGKKGSEILFSRQGSSGNWGVIQIADKTQNSILSFCKIEYSHYIRSIVKDDNATGAISCYKSNPTIEYCIITKSWSGINCKQSSNPQINHCNIVLNEYGLECNTASLPSILNSIIWKNTNALYVNGGSAPTFSYSLLQENPAKSGIEDNGTNLIGINPYFIDDSQGNFKLRKDSPCKKKAKDKSNMGVL